MIGTSLGLIAAYFGGRVDTLIMRVVDLQLCFPAILVALMLLAVLGQGIDKIIIALVVVQWAYYARTVRGTALVERQREYVEAAHCLGPAHAAHPVPPPAAQLPAAADRGRPRSRWRNAIALEATLSFLGLGVPITEPSLGLLIANGYDYMLCGRYWITFFPGIALLVTIVGHQPGRRPAARRAQPAG